MNDILPPFLKKGDHVALISPSGVIDEALVLAAKEVYESWGLVAEIGTSALKKNGVAVDRFNLNNAPMAFVNNKVINSFINEKGVDELPVVMLDEEIIITGRYPSNEEIISFLDIPKSYLTEAKSTKKGGCGCSDGSCC